jgi:hypothetical protein
MKTVMFLGVFLLCSLILEAQVELRPYVGVNSSSMTKGNTSTVDFKDGIGYQLGLDLQIGKRIYLQPGVSFEMIKNEVGTEVIDLNADLSLQRIRVPLLIGFRLFESGIRSNFNIRWFTGPNFSYIVNKDLDERLVFDEHDFKDANWGWNFGAGVDFSVFFVDAGYTVGLSDVLENNVYVESLNNNLFYANAGLRVRF